MGLDLARVRDYPALCICEVVRTVTDQIIHSDAWHASNFACERPYCRERVDVRYIVRHLDRMQRPGRDAGVAPVIELTRAWTANVASRLPGVPINLLVDVSGGDYAPGFREAFAGTRARLTFVEMTASGSDPGHALGQQWLRVSRTRLLMNLERRFDDRALELPREVFDTVRKELFAMRRTITDARNVQFVSGPNDDLVVAAALSTWPDPWPAQPVAHAPSEIIWN